jgi:hypothetical protein
MLTSCQPETSNIVGLRFSETAAADAIELESKNAVERIPVFLRKLRRD